MVVRLEQYDHKVFLRLDDMMAPLGHDSMRLVCGVRKEQT